MTFSGRRRVREQRTCAGSVGCGAARWCWRSKPAAGRARRRVGRSRLLPVANHFPHAGGRAHRGLRPSFRGGVVPIAQDFRRVMAATPHPAKLLLGGPSAFGVGVGELRPALNVLPPPQFAVVKLGPVVTGRSAPRGHHRYRWRVTTARTRPVGGEQRFASGGVAAARRQRWRA